MAEKFEAVVRLGIANTRMKDFYDLWAVATTFAFDGESLAAALAATFDNRGTALPGRAAARAAPGVHRRHREAGAMVGLLAPRRGLSRHRASMPLPRCSVDSCCHRPPRLPAGNPSNRSGRQVGTGSPIEKREGGVLVGGVGSGSKISNRSGWSTPCPGAGRPTRLRGEQRRLGPVVLVPPRTNLSRLVPIQHAPSTLMRR